MEQTCIKARINHILDSRRDVSPLIPSQSRTAAKNPDSIILIHQSPKMRFLHIATAATLTGLTTAAPTRREDDFKPPFGISFTYVNGTFADVFSVPDSLEIYPLSKDPGIQHKPQ